MASTLKRLLPALALMALVITEPILAITPHAQEEGNSDYIFDAGPIALMLVNTLNQLRLGDYQAVIVYSKTALESQSIPTNLQYLHEKTWKTILKFAQLVQSSQNKSEINKSVILELYRRKIELEEVLPKYTSKLIPQIRDPTTRYQVSKALKQMLPSLDQELNDIIMRIASGLEYKGIKLRVIVPESVYAGGTLPVEIEFNQTIYVTYIYIVFKLQSGITLNATKIPVYMELSNYSLTYKIPGTETGYYSSEHTSAQILITVEGFQNETRVLSSGLASIIVNAVKPELYFKIPAIVAPGENLTFTIFSKASEDIIMELSITNESSRAPLMNLTLTIPPGTSRHLVNTSWLAPGIYTLHMKTIPHGKYLPRTYSKGIIISGEAIATVSGPTLVIGPPFGALINIYIKKPINGTVIIKDGDKIVYETVLNGTKRSLAVQLPLRMVWLASDIKYKVEIVEENSGRAVPVRYSLVIPAVNILSIIIITIIAFTFISLSAQGYAVLLNSLSPIIIALQRGRRKTPLGYMDLFRKLIALLSRYTQPPEPSETLREYYARVTSSLSSITSSGKSMLFRVLWRFILLYEQLLYAQRKPVVDELRRLYREITRMLRW